MEVDLDSNSEKRKLQTIFQRCCTRDEWKYLMSCANFTKVFLQMDSVEDFEAVCEAGANLLNKANIPGKAQETKKRFLECREKLEQELQREGLRFQAH